MEKKRRKRWWIWASLATVFFCCVVPEGCLTSYAIRRHEAVEHPKKNIQATVFRSNYGAMTSFGYFVVIGIKGARPYWRMAQITFYDGNAPELTWIGDTLRIDIRSKTNLVDGVEEVTTLSGHTIKIEVYKNGDLLRTSQ